MPTLSDWDNWIEQSKAKFAPYEVPIEEREQAITEGEVGQYPGDDPEKFLKSGRKDFAKLKSDRLALTDQVKKARAKEKELHPYPKLERAFSAVTGSVPSFLSPDVPAPELPAPPTPDAVVAPAQRPMPESPQAQRAPSISSSAQQVPLSDSPPLGTRQDDRFGVRPVPPLDVRGMQRTMQKKSADLTRRRKELDDLQGQLDKLNPQFQIRTGQYPTLTDEEREQYDVTRNVFNQKAQEFNAQRDEYNRLTKQFNKKIDARARQQVTPQIRPTIDRFGSSMDFGTPDTVVQNQAAATPKPRSFGEALTLATNNLFQGAAGIPADILKSIAIASKDVDAWLPEALKDKRPVEDLLTYKMGQAVERVAKRAFPSDPESQKEFIVGVLPQAVGSMAAFMTGGLVGAATKSPALVGGAISSLMGAGAQGTQQYEEAKSFGADEPTQRKAFWLGSAVGSSESLPIAGLLNRFNKATGGGFFKVLKESGVTAAQEFIQEWGQQVGSNAIAKELYDENRGLLEGAGISGAAGGVTGAVTGLLSGVIAGRKIRKQQQAHEGKATESPFVEESPLRTTPLRMPQPIQPSIQQTVPLSPSPHDLIASIPSELTVSQRPPFLIKQTQPVAQPVPTPESVMLSQPQQVAPPVTVTPETGPEPMPLPHASALEPLPSPTAPPERTMAPEPEAAPSVEDIHAVAESKGIPYDNNRQFMDLTEEVTGKRHLDNLTGPERADMVQAIEAQPSQQRPYVPGDPIDTDMRKAVDAPIDEQAEPQAEPHVIQSSAGSLAVIDRMYRDILDDTKTVFRMKRDQKDAWKTVKRIDRLIQDGLKSGLDYGAAAEKVPAQDLAALAAILEQSGKTTAKNHIPAAPATPDLVAKSKPMPDAPTPDAVFQNPQVERPRSELPIEQNMEMQLRAEKAEADLQIAGKETGRRKVFIESQGQGGTPDVIGLKSAAPDWYTELTTGPRPLKRAQIDAAIQKIIKDHGVDVGVAVERVKEALLGDHEFNKTPWGKDAESIRQGEWPSWIEKPTGQAVPTPDEALTKAVPQQGGPVSPSVPTPDLALTAPFVKPDESPNKKAKVEPTDLSTASYSDLVRMISPDSASMKQKESLQELIARYKPGNPFAGKAARERLKYEAMIRPTARDKAMEHTFPLGAGFGHAGDARRLDAHIDRAVEAEQHGKAAKYFESQAEAFDRGEINAQGRAISRESLKRSEQRDARQQARQERIDKAKEIRGDKPQWQVPAGIWADSSGYLGGSARDLVLSEHRSAVKAALDEGKPVPAEVLADYPDLQPQPTPDQVVLPPKVKPSKAVQPPATPETVMLQDVGEKIGGARKDKWAERGLTMSDLEGMTGGEESKFIVKANIWKPDYAAMVSAGTEPKAAALVKTIYDRLSAKPAQDTPEGRRRYLTMMGHVKGVLGEVKTMQDVKNVQDRIFQEKLAWGDNGWKDEEKRATLRSVYKTNKDPFGIDWLDQRRADKLVAAGFPEQAPWTRRYRVFQEHYPGNLTEHGAEVYAKRVPDADPWKSTFHNEQDLARQFQAGGVWSVLDKSGKIIGYRTDRAGAEKLAAETYENKKASMGEGSEEPSRPHLDNLNREGDDYRSDRNVTAEDFRKEFGFRGVEFGNWAASDERQKHINQAYDALMDMAKTLNLPPQAVSLNGTLGVAFGARGGGHASAHYEPSKLVINITKINGPGAMAHEWGHALDHYFGEVDKPNAYQGLPKGISGWRGSHRGMRRENLRPEMRTAFNDLMETLFSRDRTKAERIRDIELKLENVKAALAKAEAAKHDTSDWKDYIVRLKDDVEGFGRLLAQTIGEEKPAGGYGKVETSYSKEANALSGKTGDYWKRPTEMFARAFESYVFDRLGRKSQYLVHGVEPSRFKDGYKGNPYPTGLERESINQAFDKLFSTMKSKPTDKGVALYSPDRTLGTPHEVLTSANRSDTLQPRRQHAHHIEERFGDALREESGIDSKSLTAPEAAYLVGLRDADALRDRAAKANSERVRRLSGKGIPRAEDRSVTPPQESSPDSSITELSAPDRSASSEQNAEPSSSAKELADLFKQESEHAKKAVRPTQPRISVAPIMGGTSKPLGEIVLDLEKGTGKKIVVGKTKPGTAGVYKPGSGATIIKYSGDLDTTAHELSHALDDQYGLVKDWKGQDTSPFDAELEPFSQHGSSDPNASPTYNRAEGVAEYLRAWMVNPDAAEAAAPQFTAHVKAKLPADIQKALQAFSTQIRQWYGNTAHAKIMANVQWETPETGLTQWLTGSRTARGPGFQLTFGDQMATAWTDRLAPFMRALKYAREQRGLDQEQVLPGDDPALLSRLFMGVNAKLDDIFAHGMVNSRLERATPGGLPWMIEPLDRTSAQSLDADMQEVATLMIAQRTIEKEQQLGRPGISGIGAGLEEDVEVARDRVEELKKDPARYAKLQEAASRYRQWADANLRYLVDKGRLSQEQYEGIKDNNEQYVAMQRILEVSPGEELAAFMPKGTPSRKIGAVGTPVHSFKGSRKAIKNPYLSLMDATHRSIREADRNEIMKLFRDLLTTDRGLYEGEPNDLASVGREAQAGEQQTIPIFVNGKKEIWQFHPDVYKALKGIEDGTYTLPPFLTILPRILRATIVNTPAFALRNVIRDSWQRSIASLSGSKPWDTLKVYSKEEISQLKRSGGDQAGHYYTDSKNYARAMKFAMQEAVASHNSIVVNPAKLATWVKQGGQGYLDLMQGSERQGRLSEYRRAFRKAQQQFGYDDYHAMLYAASQSRGLIDYAIAGNTMALLNQLIPFSNAAVQGLRSNMLRAKADPAGFALRFGVFALVPALMNYAWNYLYDDDDLDEYRQLPAYQRDLFWNFKLGPDLWLKVPKPFELGVMASSFERALDYSTGNTKAFDGHVGAFLRTLLPVDDASLAGPYQSWLQAATNYDFFRDRPIVPRWEENLALDLRNYHRASRLGQALQQAVGVDARKIDFLLQSQFGYVGRYAVDLSDTGRKDRHGLTLSASGVTGGSPASVSLDAKEVSRIAEERGVVPSRSKAVDRITNMTQITPRTAKHPDSLRYAVFRKHLNEYYKAESREDRDRLAKQVRADAKYLRDLWEKQLPRPEADEKIKKKRELESEYDPFLDLMGVPQPLSKYQTALPSDRP